MELRRHPGRHTPQNLLCAEVTDLPEPAVLQARLDALNHALGSSSTRILHHRRVAAMLEELGVGRGQSTVSLGLTPSRFVLAADQDRVDGLGLLAALTRVSGHPVSTEVDVWTPTPTPRPEDGTTTRPGGHRTRRTPTHVAFAHYRDDLLADVFAAIRIRRQVPGTHLLSAAARATRRYNARRETGVKDLEVTWSGFTSGGADPELGTHSVLLRAGGLKRLTPGRITEALRHAPREPVYEVGRAKQHTSTLLAAHLGTLTCPDVVRSIELYPAAGRAFGVALGATTEGDHTIITARARRARYTTQGMQELLELVRNVLM